MFTLTPPTKMEEELNAALVPEGGGEIVKAKAELREQGEEWRQPA